METSKHHIQDSLRGSVLVLSLPWPVRMGQAQLLPLPQEHKGEDKT